MRPSIAPVLSVLVFTSGILAAQLPSPKPPQFRAGVDVVELDVSVFDKEHHPIKGLTAADFTLLEDKLPRPLVALSEIDIPPPPPPTARWIRDATEDVATNDVKDRRLFLLCIDDASFSYNLRFKEVRDRLIGAATTFIRHLGPTDLAAVIFSGDNRRSQDFTSDHARLVASVEQAWAPDMPLPLQIRYSAEMLRRATDYMVGVPGRRKAIVAITAFDADMIPKCNPTYTACEAIHYAVNQTKLIFGAAQRAGVNVYLMRLGARLAVGGITTSNANAVGPDARWFTSLPHETGGEAFLGIEDPRVADDAATRIFEAMSSYYMLGYTSADVKKFHFIKVSVDRPGAEVRTREKFYSPAETKEPIGPAPPATVASLAGILPKADVPLRVTAASFAAIPDLQRPGGRPMPRTGASVAVVLNVHHVRGESTAPVREKLDLRVGTFTAEGNAEGSIVKTLQLTLPAGAGDVDYEILTRVDISKLGLHELRLSAHSAARNADGAVYVTVDVPDFAKEPISLSGIVVGTGGDLIVDGKEAVASLLPVTPTTVRVFGRGDRATAFLRVYQGGGGAMKSVAAHIRIVDEHDRAVVDRTDVVSPDRFGAARSAALSLPLPTDTLAPGAYLLTVETAVQNAMMRRELRFTVK